MRRKLEFQAERIEQALSLHKAPGRVTGGTVTPRWIRFQVIPAVGVKLAKVKSLAEELAAALDVANCRITRTGASLALEIPRDDPKPVRLIPLYQQLTNEQTKPMPPATAILGLAEDGAPLLIRLPSPDVAHILVAGTTGSGKTVLLQTMITSLAMTNTPSELALILIDPKRHAFTPFELLPHLARPIISDIEQTTELLSSLVKLMEMRGAKSETDSTIVVVIDELIDVLLVGGKKVQLAMTRLTQRGREAGIHIIAATQKPTSAVLGPLVKANFPVRLVGRVTSTEDARTATGWSGTGAERLTGQGDFVAVAEGRVIHFQVAHISRAEIEKAVSNIHGEAQPTTIPPPPPPEPDQTVKLATKLAGWDEWPKRHKDSTAREYRWGFRTAACRYIFDKEMAGTWARRLDAILSLAEEISTTTTTTKPNPQAAIPPLPRIPTSSSRNYTRLHAAKPASTTTLTQIATIPFTDREVILALMMGIEFGIIMILAGNLMK